MPSRMTIETTTDRLEMEEEQRPMRPAGVPSGEAIGNPGDLADALFDALEK
jgi:hypothetical protein